MNAILVLLALLSLATLAGRRGGTAAFLSAATTPLLVALGVGLSPHGLGFLLPSMAAALLPALHVAVAWLALLVGLRVSPPWTPGFVRGSGWLLLSLVLGVGGALLTAMALAVAAPGWFPWGRTGVAQLLGLLCVPACLVGGTASRTVAVLVDRWPPGALKERLLFVARHDDVLAALALLWTPWLGAQALRTGAASAAAASNTVVVVASGLGLAAAALILGVSRPGREKAARPVLAALCVVAAGVSVMAGQPEGATAYIMGGVLALGGSGQRILGGSSGGDALDRPVRLAVLPLAGLLWTPSWAAVALGAALALGRLGGRTVLAVALGRAFRQAVPVTVLLPSAGLAVPLAVSLRLALPPGGLTDVLFAGVVVAVCLTDLGVFAWNFGAWMRRGPARPITFPGIPRVEGDGA